MLSSLCDTVTARELSGEEISVSDSAQIQFQQSKSQLNLSLGNNQKELDRLVGFMNRYKNPDSLFTLHRVKVIGGASPEGSVAINERLSRLRADNIFDYFSTRESIPDSVTSFEFLGRDWKGLRSLVEFDTRVPYQREVLSLLDDIITANPENAVVSDKGLKQLRQLRAGIPYLYLYNNLFPRLRESKLYVEYIRKPSLPQMADTLPAPDVTEILLPPVVEILPEPEFIEPPTIQCRPFYMAVKTNMLYDALALPNIGIEFYVGKNWSVGGNWMYGWWDSNKRHRYWRAYGGDLYVRRWFGSKALEKPLTGHHIGVYGGVVTYDFEFGGKGYMGGLPDKTLWDRCNYIGGIEYGYSLPIARRLNIDFTIGVGYMGGKVQEYAPENGHYVWQKTKNLHWVGPTKAEISLVWLIGCDNYNRSLKGGDR
ncbi:MAG: DUF3575 domain-containing protein [Muribaculaceae bacterium]|nr:DUF3575 domain-containing protein [Muribaculaceae bacterium]